MKTIKIFLASSEELAVDRVHIGDFVANRVNNIYRPRSIELRLIKWEDLDFAYTGTRTQDMYNRSLRSSDLFVALFHYRAGRYTLEEVDQARNGFNLHNKPRICFFFKQQEYPDQETPELTGFKHLLRDKLQHFTTRPYAHIDSLFLDILLQILLTENAGMKLEAENGMVCIGGFAMISMANLPFAANNEGLNRLKEDIKDCDKKIARLEADMADAPRTPLSSYLYDELSRREKLIEAVNQKENALLDTAFAIAKMTGVRHSSRLQRAVELFGQGDDKGANAVLNLNDILADAVQNARTLDAARGIAEEALGAMRENIDELRQKIMLTCSIMAEGWVDAAGQLYEHMIDLSTGRLTDTETATLLHETALFYYRNNQFHRIGTKLDEAIKLRRHLPEPDMPSLAESLNLRGLLETHMGHFERAISDFQECINLAARLMTSSCDPYAAMVAEFHHNLAVAYTQMEDYDKAHKEHECALALRRHLVEIGMESHTKDVAGSLNDLAILYANIGKDKEAEQANIEALSIRRGLMAKDPDTYSAEVACSLANLAANRLMRNPASREAESNCKEALAIYRNLVRKAPETYAPRLAMTLHNMAMIHSAMGMPASAEEEVTEALSIRRLLASKNPGVFEVFVAMSLLELGNEHFGRGKHDEARSEYEECLAIFHRHMKAGYGSLALKVTYALTNLGQLHEASARYDTAESSYTEALHILRLLDSKTPKQVESNIAGILTRLARLHTLFFRNKLDLAKRELEEALAIYENLMKADPGKYMEAAMEALMVNNFLIQSKR